MSARVAKRVREVVGTRDATTTEACKKDGHGDDTEHGGEVKNETERSDETKITAATPANTSQNTTGKPKQRQRATPE